MVYRKVFENINFIWGDVYNERWPGVKEGYPPPLSMVLAGIFPKITLINKTLKYAPWGRQTLLMAAVVAANIALAGNSNTITK